MLHTTVVGRPVICLVTLINTPARVKLHEVRVLPLFRWAYDGRTKANAASPLRESNHGGLARREARGEERVIEQGKTDSILQTKSGPYQSIQKVPVMFRTLSATLANETRGSSIPPIYQKYL
jgi:hypothetical protein